MIYRWETQSIENIAIVYLLTCQFHILEIFVIAQSQPSSLDSLHAPEGNLGKLSVLLLFEYYKHELAPISTKCLQQNQTSKSDLPSVDSAPDKQASRLGIQKFKNLKINFSNYTATPSAAGVSNTTKPPWCQSTLRGACLSWRLLPMLKPGEGFGTLLAFFARSFQFST